MPNETKSEPIDAIYAIRERLKELYQARSAAGEPTPGHALCAHFGRVLYGNIGSRVRLELKTISEIVNAAARGVSTAKLLGKDYIFTHTFIKQFKSSRAVSIGSHVFKGIAKPQELYVLPVGAIEEADAAGRSKSRASDDAKMD